MQINQANEINNIQPKVEFIEIDEFTENICPELGYLGFAVLFHSNVDN